MSHLSGSTSISPFLRIIDTVGHRERVAEHLCVVPTDILDMYQITSPDYPTLQDTNYTPREVNYNFSESNFPLDSVEAVFNDFVEDRFDKVVLSGLNTAASGDTLLEVKIILFSPYHNPKHVRTLVKNRLMHLYMSQCKNDYVETLPVEVIAMGQVACTGKVVSMVAYTNRGRIPVSDDAGVIERHYSGATMVSTYIHMTIAAKASPAVVL